MNAALTCMVATCFNAQAASPANINPEQNQAIKSVGGIILMPTVSLRSAPKDSAMQQAELWQGEWVEIRGKRLNYIQVYDYKRERTGYIKEDAIRATSLDAADAGQLLTIMRYVAQNKGSESLGIGLGTAYINAASSADVNSEKGAEVLDNIGLFADRLADQASSQQPLSKTAANSLAHQLEVATQYGVQFNTLERDGHIQMCYNGDVYRRVLAMPASPETMVHAALALSNPQCAAANVSPIAQAQLDTWRLDVIQRVNTQTLEPFLKNRVALRKASLLASLSYAKNRLTHTPEAAQLTGITEKYTSLMQQSLDTFSTVQKNELPDEDWGNYNDTAMLLNANRWAAVEPISKQQDIQVSMQTGAVGETCVIVNKGKQILTKRCTYGTVWLASSNINREKNAITLAVQPVAGWRELWLINLTKDGWQFNVLPPNNRETGLGYAEFAGWVPGGKQMLVARESRSQGMYQRSFEVMNIDNLTVQHQARDASLLGAFQRWQDPNWKANSLSVR